MSNEDKVNPFIFATLFGEEVKIQYTMRSARLFKRLTDKNLLGDFNWRDPDHMVSFWVAGLVQHQRKLVGDIDAKGKPNAVMQSLIDRLEDQSSHIADVMDFAEPFIAALALSRTLPKKAEEGEAEDSSGK